MEKQKKKSNSAGADKKKSSQLLLDISEGSKATSRQQHIIDSVDKMEYVVDITKLLPYFTKKSNAPPHPSLLNQPPSPDRNNEQDSSAPIIEIPVDQSHDESSTAMPYEERGVMNREDSELFNSRPNSTATMTTRFSTQNNTPFKNSPL